RRTPCTGRYGRRRMRRGARGPRRRWARRGRSPAPRAADRTPPEPRPGSSWRRSTSFPNAAAAQKAVVKTAQSPPYHAYAAIMATFVGGLAAAGVLARLLDRDPYEHTAL